MDHACLTLGRWVENKLEERDRKGKRIHKLEGLLVDPNDEDTGREKAAGVSEFRQAAPLARKVRVPESGIW